MYQYMSVSSYCFEYKLIFDMLMHVLGSWLGLVAAAEAWREAPPATTRAKTMIVIQAGALVKARFLSSCRPPAFVSTALIVSFPSCLQSGDCSYRLS
jgi:hypothetical protein